MPYNCSRRARVEDRPIPSRTTPSSGIPAPLSRTSSSRLLPIARALTSMSPCAVRRDVPCRIAFSTSGCSSKCGTRVSSMRGSIWNCTLRRGPNLASCNSTYLRKNESSFSSNVSDAYWIAGRDATTHSALRAGVRLAVAHRERAPKSHAAGWRESAAVAVSSARAVALLPTVSARLLR